MSRRLDVAKGELGGDPQLIANAIGDSTVRVNTGSLSTSLNGTIAYRVDSNPVVESNWVDRAGRPVGAPGELAGVVWAAEVSPDGQRVAVDLTTGGNRDIWLLNQAQAGRTRLTREGQVLYDYSKQIIQTFESLHSKLQEIKDIISGTIARSSCPPTYCFIRFLSAFALPT